MTEQQRQRRIGQILLVCKIIQLENQSFCTIPRVHVSDLCKWLDADEEYISAIINVCASLDKRNIADDVLNNAHIYRNMEIRYQSKDIMLLFWRSYLDTQLGVVDKATFENDVTDYAREIGMSGIMVEGIFQLLNDFATELILRVHEFASTNMSHLDVVLEIGELNNYAKEDYFTLRKMLLGMEREESDISER